MSVCGYPSLPFQRRFARLPSSICLFKRKRRKLPRNQTRPRNCSCSAKTLPSTLTKLMGACKILPLPHTYRNSPMSSQLLRLRDWKCDSAGPRRYTLLACRHTSCTSLRVFCFVQKRRRNSPRSWLMSKATPHPLASLIRLRQNLQSSGLGTAYFRSPLLPFIGCSRCATLSFGRTWPRSNCSAPKGTTLSVLPLSFQSWCTRAPVGTRRSHPKTSMRYAVSPSPKHRRPPDTCLTAPSLLLCANALAQPSLFRTHISPSQL